MSIHPDSLYTNDAKRDFSRQQKTFKDANVNMFVQDTIKIELKDGYDCRRLKSTQIINHIDHAFAIRRSSSSSKKISFEYFCEYVLPYRVILDYPLTDAPQQYSDLMGKYLESIPKDSVEGVVKRYNYISNQLRIFFPRYPYGEHVGLSALYYRGTYDCLLIGHLGITTLRSLGIPSAIEYYSAHKTFVGRHFYGIVFDENNTRFTFNPESSLPTASNITQKNENNQNGSTMNLYRLMYSEQKNTPFFMRNKEEVIPSQFESPFLKDVTEGILNITKLKLPFEAKTENRFAYLATFSSEFNDGIVPVTWGKINKLTGNVHFENVVLNRLYFPMYYDSFEQLLPFGDPFYINEDGTITYFQNKGNANVNEELIITRKFPYKPNLVERAQKNIGTTILASLKDPLLHQKDTIGIVPIMLQPYFQDIVLDMSKGPYRYYAIRSPKDSRWATVGEIQFITDTIYNYANVIAPSPLPIFHPRHTSRISSDIRLIDDKPIEDVMKRAEHDGNPQTAPGGYPKLSLELNKPQYVTKLRIMAQHADNGINIGERFRIGSKTGLNTVSVW